MTDELRELADLALRIIKADIEREGGGTAVFIVRTADGEIEQLPFPKQFAALMNDGRAKDMIFLALHETIRQRGHTAVIIATECWMAKQTEAGKAIPHADFLEYSRESGFVTAVAKGYVERFEAISVTVQTPEAVAIVTQTFERDEARRKIHFGERSEMEVPTENFHGRQKMFGALDEETSA